MKYREEEIALKIYKKNMENFNNIGGVNMYENVNSNSNFEKEKEEVFNKIKEIDAKYSLEEYNPKEITSLGLEKSDFVPPTDSEILEAAKSSLKEEKENQQDKLENDYEGKFLNLEDKFIDAGDEREEDFEKALSEYKSSLRNTTNSSIKQGISRSSIFDEAVKSIESEKEKNVSQAETEFKKTIERLESQRQLLERQKENALESFDISYAVKLENKIANINKEISKKQDEVNKANQQIELQEEQHRLAQEKANIEEQKRIEKRNAELLKQKEQLGEREFLNQQLKEKYDVVLNFLMHLPKDVALEEFTKDNSYELLLGHYYPAVHAQLLNRKD